MGELPGRRGDRNDLAVEETPALGHIGPTERCECDGIGVGAGYPQPFVVDVGDLTVES